MEFRCASCEGLFTCHNDNEIMCPNKHKRGRDYKIWCLCHKCFLVLNKADPKFFSKMCQYWNDNPSVRDK